MVLKQILQDELKGKIPDEKLDFLPTGFQAIGKIVILNLKPELEEYEKIICKKMLELFPRFKTACVKAGGITGEFRIPQIKYVIGSKETETIVKESGCIYKFDVTKIMFAKGNLNERIRIAKQVKPGEIIVDMFAGIGYFSVPIGKLAKPEKVYSIELRDESVRYLKENLKLNKITEKFEVIQGDCKEVVKELVKQGVVADRVVMGYLPMHFVDSALSVVKQGGVVHYEAIMNKKNLKKESEEIVKEINEKAEKQGKKIKLISVNYVKSYAPHKEHYVLDIRIL